VGAFALDGTRDRFADAISGYFGRSIASLRDALVRQGWDPADAGQSAEEVVLGIQGALMLTRAAPPRLVASLRAASSFHIGAPRFL
jgi:TetR/AcrR family transcriptional repressor of lmrAB and yxaGH operons